MAFEHHMGSSPSGVAVDSMQCGPACHLVCTLSTSIDGCWPSWCLLPRWIVGALKRTVLVCRITSSRRISVDDDRVDAVISHLEGVNTTLKSLRSQGGDLEPFLGSEQVKLQFLKANNLFKSWASATKPYVSPAAL